MRIQPGEMIAGQPALAVRKLMQHGRAFGPTTSGNPLSTIAEVLGIDRSMAPQVYQELCREGYIEPVPENHLFYEPGHWFTTIKGNALANASTRKPITRRTAERLIEELLVRWEKKGENYRPFLHRACAQLIFAKVLVFG